MTQSAMKILTINSFRYISSYLFLVLFFLLSIKINRFFKNKRIEVYDMFEYINQTKIPDFVFFYIVLIPFVLYRKSSGTSPDCPTGRDKRNFSGFGTVPQDSTYNTNTILYITNILLIRWPSATFIQ